MNTRGITLVELIIVIAIISLLAAVAIPGYIGQQKKAARTEAYSNLEALRLLEEQFFAENGQYAASAGNAGADQPGNIALIRAQLPGFRPGTDTDLQFSYRIIRNQSITNSTSNPPTFGASATECFVAIATGNTKTRVSGDVFAIDCVNTRNF